MKLPARFARLSYRFTIVFVGEAVASPAAAFATSTTTATTWSTAGVRSTTRAGAIVEAALAGARRAAFALGACLVHLEVASAKFLAIQARHGRGGFRIIGHLNEGKAPRAAGFDAARDIEGITVNRWAHGYAFTPNPLFDPDWKEEEKPWAIGRKRVGRIAIANSDAGASVYTNVAIDQAWRAIGDLLA